MNERVGGVGGMIVLLCSFTDVDMNKSVTDLVCIDNE
jgi:hypothetical protein